MGHYDEVYDERRVPRDHWRYLIDSINQLGSTGLAERHKKALRILRDDGATYNLRSSQHSNHAWELDPIPMLLTSAEWSEIESGLAERSELLDLILKDLYGPREIIRQGLLPPQILFSHPGFLRSCQDIRLPGEHQLILHATDMVRDPDGKMRIIGDRTQAPSGSGYALENRTVLSRVMPSLFRDSQVHRLSLFFRSLRSTLSTLAANRTDDPGIVILTPGAYSETYFEHTYLSNYLGFPLVQGNDLTVRDGKVWMKSPNGLSRVDVILRRVDDIYCDQVELKTDSYLGVPGLLEAARAGNVSIANPLGSGILETPALLKYLPAISKFFLGRDLKLPSVQTWWCGDKDDMRFIQANLDSLIIKPAIRQLDSPSIYGHLLSKTGKAEVLTRINTAPHKYVAQSYLAPSYLPSWQQGEIQPRPTIFRGFSVSNNSDYTIMPGGLTRVALSDQDTVVTNSSGSQSKDTWILASEPEKQISLIEAKPRKHDYAHQTNLPSRVVENLFWLGRYAERAESTMRLARTVFMQLNGIEPLPQKSRELLLRSLSLQTGCLPGFTDSSEPLLKHPDKELLSLILDGLRPGSIKSSLLSLLTCSEEVKEMMSADTHRIVNDLRDHLYDLDRAYVSGLPSAPEETLDPLVTSLLALSGLNHESMLRGTGWTFQEIGRRTERTIQTARLIQSLLEAHLPVTEQQQILEAVLLSVEALITFRRRYRNLSDVAHGLDLLLSDSSNPRSLLYQLQQLLSHIDDLPGTEANHQGLNKEKRLIIKSLNEIQLADLTQLAKPDSHSAKRKGLISLMQNMIDQMESLAVVIGNKYFDHSQGPQQLVRKRKRDEP